MTDDDIKQLRELAQAATKGPWKHLQSGRGYENYVYALDARYDVSWAGESPVKVAYFPHDPYGLRDALDAAYIAAASPDVLLALLSRLEATERERGAERAVAIGHLSQVNAFRAERDALRALLAEARAHLPPPVLGERRLADRIDTALAAKESDRG